MSEFFKAYGFEHNCHCLSDYHEGNVEPATHCFLELHEKAMEELAECRKKLGFYETVIAHLRVQIVELGGKPRG